MRARRKFTIEFKRDIVEQIKSGAVGVVQASREHEISATLIYKWLDKYEHGKLNNEPSQRGALENKIAELERKIGQQAMEIDLLKKLRKINERRQREVQSLVMQKAQSDKSAKR
jgi:transposase